MPMPKTDKEKEIYQQMLEDYKDDPFNLEVIENFKNTTSPTISWEMFQNQMDY